jgi:phosphatidylserine/phosphatidylglycerophosphate/cardiolipin synthase-like enzyme
MRLAGGSLGIPQAKPLGFAPNGASDVAKAVKPMLERAKAYAYLEDQFLSSDDVMSWLNTALKKSGDLRVVLVTGRPDPGDPPTPIGKAFARAVNDYLLDGVADVDRRIAVLQHLHHVVHAKLAIVDDQEAVIGSANWARRGLYTDIEHSLHFEDPVSSLVGDRQAIWSHHLGSSPASISAAVDAWFAIPFGSGHATFERLALPISTASPTAMEDWELSTVTDPDSRQSWPPLPPITIPGVPGVPPIPPVP